MKPKEFDDLVRQKFDRGDFEYNPRNWERLAEQLDGRTKKRSIIMWWWVPLAGIAASVALAIGISFMARQGAYAPPLAAAKAEHSHTLTNKEMAHANMAVPPSMVTGMHNGNTAHAQEKRVYANQHLDTKVTEKVIDNTQGFAIKLQNAIVEEKKKTAPAPFNFLRSGETQNIKKEKKELALDEPVHTFKPEAETAKPTKSSIILLGGITHGNASSGYVAGANFRKMVNDRLYMESDVAYESSNNSQATYVPVANASSVSRHASAGRNVNPDGRAPAPVEPAATVVEAENQSYTMGYAQVSPGLGYKVVKKLSIGMGPDFQQMLADNKPVQSTEYYRGAIQEAPSFDVGFIGKSEYSITKNIKAGVSYRKGINNFITPTATDKYIDRDYLQFQLKCAIFNK